MPFRKECVHGTVEHTDKIILEDCNLEASTSETKQEASLSTTEAYAAYSWSNKVLKPTWFQTIVLWIIRQGSIPDHVASMPDGNRRFAKRTNITLPQSYYIGVIRFQQMCRILSRTGVRKVTGFLFSTRNLNRSAFEIGSILSEITSLCMATLADLGAGRHVGVLFRAVGVLELLPKKVQATLGQVEIATSSDTRDITSELIERYLDVNVAPEAELWYRAAGDPRFSDFVVYQSRYSYMHITPKQWPDTTTWDWIWALLQFQLHWPFISAVKERHRRLEGLEGSTPDTAQILRQNTFLRRVRAARVAYTEKISGVA
ncbi:isoprenyl transferase-like isoform X3 [Haemaphysalis longicornis]